ncbi:MAG: hypothetical protein ACHQ9S_13765 [Candidatus Binatia bacterium]
MKTKEPVETIKCTVKLNAELWRAARHRALDERRDFQDVVASALTLYLKQPLRGGKP